MMAECKTPKKRHVSSVGVQTLIDVIVESVVDSGKQYTHVMGISRGGLIPAVYISHALGLPLAITSYSAPEGKGTGTQNKFTWQDDKHVEIDQGSVVLVVDDIVDSGCTKAHVLEELNVYVAVVDYAALYEKEGCVQSGVDALGYVGEYLEEDAPWIVFPWEQ